VDSQRVAYKGFENLTLIGDVRGNEGDWPVLFLHGGGQTRHAWGKTGRILRTRLGEHHIGSEGPRVRVTGAPNGDYFLHRILRRLRSRGGPVGKPPVLVGASLGGIAAILAEGTSDRTVSRDWCWWICRPSRTRGYHSDPNFMRSGLDGFATLEDAARAIAAYTPQRARKTNPED